MKKILSSFALAAAMIFSAAPAWAASTFNIASPDTIAGQSDKTEYRVFGPAGSYESLGSVNPDGSVFISSGQMTAGDGTYTLIATTNADCTSIVSCQSADPDFDSFTFSISNGQFATGGGGGGSENLLEGMLGAPTAFMAATVWETAQGVGIYLLSLFATLTVFTVGIALLSRAKKGIVQAVR